MAINHFFEWENVTIQEAGDYEINIPEPSGWTNGETISGIMPYMAYIGSDYAGWGYEISHPWVGGVFDAGIVPEGGTSIQSNDNELAYYYHYISESERLYHIGFDTYTNPSIENNVSNFYGLTCIIYGQVVCPVSGTLRLCAPYTDQELVLDASEGSLNLTLSRFDVRSVLKVYSPENSLLIEDDAKTDYTGKINPQKGVYTFKVTPFLMPNETRTLELTLLEGGEDPTWNFKGIFPNTKPALFCGRRGVRGI